MPFLLPRLHAPLASPLRLRSSSSATPGGFLLCSGHSGARRLHAADNRVVLGCGLVTLDYLATVDAYTRPDDKIRTGELQISGGGNAGNALSAAARLGLSTRVISKVGNDETGGTVLSELNEAGIDTSHVIISDGGNTTFVYIIIDKQTKTRTCILTPGEPQMVPSDLSVSSLSAALQDVSLLYLDGYAPEVALAVAKQTSTEHMLEMPDAEDLLPPLRSDYVDAYMPPVDMSRYSNLAFATVDPPAPNPAHVIRRALLTHAGNPRAQIFQSSQD